MELQKFTKRQQSVVMINLMELTPHRDIARHLQKLYEGIKPSAMTQEEYEEIVIKRCKDYASNKDRKPYHEIKKGRDLRRDDHIDTLAWLLRYLADGIKWEWKDEMKQIEFADAIVLFEKAYDLKMEIDKRVFGEVLDDENEADCDEIEDDRPFWEVWNDTEWKQILQERKESGDSLKDSAPVGQAVDSFPETSQNSGAISPT